MNPSGPWGPHPVLLIRWYRFICGTISVPAMFPALIRGVMSTGQGVRSCGRNAVMLVE